MLKLIGIELFKMSRRPRTYLGPSAFLIISVLVMLGMKYGGLDGELARGAGSAGMFQVAGSPANAAFMAWAVGASQMSAPILIMFMPFFTCLVFGEIMAGEATDGTLRMVFSRAVTRSGFFAAKFISCLIYGLGLTFSLGLLAYLVGLIFFGHGGLLTTGTMDKMMIAWYGESEGVLRLLGCYFLTSLGMMAIGMIAFLISTWLNNSLGAVGAAIMLLFSMFIVGEIKWFKPIKPYLVSTHFFSGGKVFLDPVPWNEIGSAVVTLTVYIVALFTISWLIFRRKDILG